MNVKPFNKQFYYNFYESRNHSVLPINTYTGIIILMFSGQSIKTIASVGFEQTVPTNEHMMVEIYVFALITYRQQDIK
jgi:hypothetical protein